MNEVSPPFGGFDVVTKNTFISKIYSKSIMLLCQQD